MKSKLFVMVCGLMVAGIAHAERKGDPAQREAFHQALEACHAETGVARPERGTRPSEADRAKMDECMNAKGLKMPHHPHGKDHRRPATAEEGAANQ